MSRCSRTWWYKDKTIDDKDKYIVVKVFKKPVGPIVGFVSQFLFMPLFSFLVGWIITDDYLFRCLSPNNFFRCLLPKYLFKQKFIV